MDMKKDFRIWLNESSYNDFITRAMDQANEGEYSKNLQFETEFKMMVDSNHDPIALKKALEDSEVPLETAELSMVPQNTVPVEDPDLARRILTLMDEFEDHDDIQNIYANFDIPEEILRQLD